MVKTSIIVPVYNREDFIRPCLDSLLCQTEGNYEIIVVDDASTDKTKEILSSYQDARLRIFYNDIQKGPSFSRNKAAAEARGEFLAFADSDCVARKDWLEKLTRGFKNDLEIVIVGGQVLDSPEGNYWELVNSQGDFVSKKEGFVKKIIGCNMAARRDFFLRNKFDEEVYPSEELDLCIRCEKQNKQIYYIPSAQVVHFRRSSFLSTLVQQFNYGFWNTYVNLRNCKFPFLSLGAWILLGGALFVGLGHFYITAGLSVVYLGLVSYVSISQKKFNFKRLIETYPGFLIACLSNSTGSLCGIPASLWRLLRR